MRPTNVKPIWGTYFIHNPVPYQTKDRPTRLRAMAKLVGLSPIGLNHLEWFLWHEGHGQNARQTCRHFGVSPKTFYKWRKRFDDTNLLKLDNRSRAPVKRRSRMITPEEELRIITLKRAHIRYGKMKIAVLYQTQYQTPISSWKVQKVIEAKQLYYNPVRAAKSRQKRAHGPARKRITELQTKPLTGFLLCLDSITIFWQNTKRTIFTAIDRHAKVAFARMYHSKGSVNARDFLYRLHHLMDGKIENIGHDNGSEFQGAFRQACTKLAIPQYHSRVRTPEDNAINERFNRTLQEEFVALGNMTFDTTAFNHRLTEWLIEYNFHRPHQALGYLSPINFIQKYHPVLPMYSSHTGRRMCGALITSHKAAVYGAAHDLFDRVSRASVRLGEIGMVYWDDGGLVGDANDAISSREAGRSLLLSSDAWLRGSREALILGGGGAGLALADTLAVETDIGCCRVIITESDRARAASIREIVDEWANCIPIEVVISSGPSDNLVSSMGEGCLIANATGLGKDSPGSPITALTEFPRYAHLWEFNYRFVEQPTPNFLEIGEARRREFGLTVWDGWEYFVWGWLVVMATAVGLTAHEYFERFRQIADQNRATR